MPSKLTWGWLALILAVYLVLGSLYATRTPDWQVPDEPAHYNYIRQISATGQIPVIQPGDWLNQYQNDLRATRFDPALLGDLHRIQYEDHQPPLYYLLQTPVYKLSDGNLETMRLFSVLIGAGVVLAAFFTILRLFPEHPYFALVTAAFVAFLPQNLSIMSGVSNDILAQLVVGLTFLLVVAYLQQEKINLAAPVLLGLLVGIAFLTKSTIYFLSSIAGVAILLRWWRERWSIAMGVQQIAAFLIPALLLGGLWWLHNLDVYGGTDFLGLQRHDVVAAEQLQTDDYINRELGGSTRQYIRNFAYTTFHSFWGQFGWMGVPMPTRIYRVLLLFTILMLIGSIVYAFRERWPKTLTDVQREMLLLFLFTIFAVFAAYLLYNRQFVQFQGRYLFAALIPFGLLIAVGLSGWASFFTRLHPLVRWLPVPAMFALALLTYYALNTYIVPQLAR